MAFSTCRNLFPSAARCRGKACTAAAPTAHSWNTTYGPCRRIRAHPQDLSHPKHLMSHVARFLRNSVYRANLIRENGGGSRSWEKQMHPHASGDFAPDSWMEKNASHVSGVSDMRMPSRSISTPRKA